VTAADGAVRTAATWGGPGGCCRVLPHAWLTAERYQAGGPPYWAVISHGDRAGDATGRAAGMAYLFGLGMTANLRPLVGPAML